MNVVILLNIQIYLFKELGKKYKIFFCNPQVIKHNYDTFSIFVIKIERMKKKEIIQLLF